MRTWHIFGLVKHAMKKTAIFLSALFLVSSSLPALTAQPSSYSGGPTTSSASALRVVKNTAFKPGEKLRYRVHYGFVDAGEAELEVMNEQKNFGNRPTYHVVGTGKSLGAFDWFFKVRDRYESYIDQEAMVPWFFIRRVDEGGYKIRENTTFNPYKNTATNEGQRQKKVIEKATYDVPANIQDMLSAFYYARTLDYSNAKVGDIYPIDAFIDNEVVPMNIKYVGKEDVKSRLGTVTCMKFKPLLQTGRVFKEQEEMTIWISDDANRIPIRLETAVIVGSVKMDLVEYTNLANPINIKK